MTREEEIQKLIDEETGIENYGSSDYQIGVYDGVRLADKTMIEKAVEWIQMNAMKYMNSIGGCMYFDVINSTKDFKKAMQNE